MEQDRISGGAIIVGSLMMIVTMMLHPVGGSLRTDIDHLTRIAGVAVAVHALALAAVAVQAFGFLGFHRALGERRHLARAGLVAYVVGWIAVCGAAVASGFIAPELIRRYPGLEGPEQEAMNALWHYNGTVNQVLTRIYVAAVGVGTMLWSLASWRHDRWWKAASALGVAVALVALLSLFSGQLHLDVTGFGLFVVGYSAWTLAVGGLLCRAKGTM